VSLCNDAVSLNSSALFSREYFVDLLSSVLTSTRFTPHEFAEAVLPSVQAESTLAAHNPASTALNVAHALAFRSGLGASLFASPAGPHFTVEDIKSFASSAFTKSSVSVFGTGISTDFLEKLVSKSLSSLPSGASGSTAPSKYHGGESRVLFEGHGPQTIFIGFGSAGPVTPELSVLAAHLSSSKSVPWSEQPVSPFPNLPKDSTVQTILLPYSDASLLGFLVQAPTTASVVQAGKAVAAGIKAAGAGIKSDALKKAIAKAKFSAATTLDTRAGLMETVSLQLLMGNKATLESVFSNIEKTSSQSTAMVSPRF
jgi:ubiquinol-cytochrome c reductase core subunit 2